MWVFPGGASGKELSCQCRKLRDTSSIPESGKSAEGHGNPLQYSCLENSIDRGTWKSTVHRVAKSQTRLKWLSTHTYIYNRCNMWICGLHQFYKHWVEKYTLSTKQNKIQTLMFLRITFKEMSYLNFQHVRAKCV